MLEFDRASKRFGALAALDACSFTARPGRLTGFLGLNGAGKTTAMRTVFGLVELDSGAVRWKGPKSGLSSGHGSGTCQRERGLYPRMRFATSSVYLGRLCGQRAPQRPTGPLTLLERLGLSCRAGDPLDALSHGNQQRRPADCRAGQRTGAPGPRRTVLWSRPARHGLDVGDAGRGRRRRDDRAVLRVTSSISSRTSATTSSSSTPAGSSGPATWLSCGQRFRSDS